MEKKRRALVLVFVSVLFIVVAQLMLKHGLNSVGGLDFSQGVVSAFLLVFQNPYILLGLFLYVCSSVLWLLVLSQAHLSFAYPILSIGYVFVAGLSWFFFGEHLSSLRLLGLGVIVTGVFLLSRT